MVLKGLITGKANCLTASRCPLIKFMLKVINYFKAYEEGNLGVITVNFSTLFLILCLKA